MSWARTIALYSGWGMQLVPLDPFVEDVRHRGKKPLHNDWNNNTYSPEALLAWAMQGGLHNLGARLAPADLVLDIDPRNGGGESYTRLLKDAKVSLENHPTVVTGGGGLHVYTRIESDLASMSEELSEYPGVEFKRAGRQVVVPGSLHCITGKRYQWRNEVREIAHAPKALLEFLAQYQYVAPTNSGEIAAITPEELEAILNQLPVESYDSNSRWFAVLAAAYHATAAEGCDEFVAWSTGDPSYSGHSKQIAARWRSLERPTGGTRSLGTLVYELNKHGGTLPESVHRKQEDDLANFEEKTSTVISKLGPGSTAVEVKKVLRLVAQMEPLEAGDALEALRQQTSRTKASLNHALKSLKAERESPKDTKMIDVPYEVAQQVLKDKFKDGRTLLHALDGRYWRFIGTHWEPYSSDQLKGLIKTLAEDYREQNPAVKFQISNTIVSAEIVVRAATASGVDLLGAKKEPEPVVNCSNCELWIKNDGTVDKRKHKPESHLTYCLPIEYDPTAKCELYADTLEGIFEPLPDGGDVIRHLWEVFGYTIQPAKPIPAWFLFQGRGANGKSLVLDVLIALLGPAARPIASITELSASKSEFAMSECVGALAIIDDDVKKGTLLNDDVLKKISENKNIRARFLRQNHFTFRNVSTPFLAANSWPQTRDLSDGMMRRAHGFPFRRQFAQDSDRKEKILETELAGVLNEALKGLIQLRARGQFDVPQSCQDLITRWASRSNQVLEYLEECHNGGRWTEPKDFRLIWEGYKHWADDSGYSRTYSKPGLHEALVSYGIKKTEEGMVGLKSRRGPGGLTCK